MFQSCLQCERPAGNCEGSAFSPWCAWPGMGVGKEPWSWTGTALIEGDDVERESSQNLELPSGWFMYSKLSSEFTTFLPPTRCLPAFGLDSGS